MANSGTARSRQNSFTTLRIRQPLRDEVVCQSPPSKSLDEIGIPIAGNRLLSKEQDRATIEEAVAPRPHLLIEGIVETLEGLQTGGNNSRDVEDSLKDNDAQSIILAEGSAESDASQSDLSVSKRTTQKKNKRTTTKPLTAERGSHLSLSTAPKANPQTMSLRPASILVASLGNPPPYQSTRHSAAHIILKHLQTQLSLPPFTLKSRAYGGGHVSVGADVGRPEITLWQSPSLMNVSGPPLLKAWKNFVTVQSTSLSDPITGLIVLHDEMETEAGKVKAKKGNTSPRGHNGIKSVQSSLQSAGLMEGLGDKYVKVGIGIGRPTGGSRASGDVSAYVLGQLTQREKDGLENATSDLISILYQEMARISQKGT